MTVVIALVITLVGVAPALCAIDVRVCTMLGTDVSVALRVDAVVELWSDALRRTLNGVAPDVGILADVDANIWFILMPVWSPSHRRDHWKSHCCFDGQHFAVAPSPPQWAVVLHKPGCLHTTCAEVLCCQQLRSFRTKNHHGRNN